jgi:hypothetical protein
MKRPEQALQMQLVAVLRYALPGVVFWHTPNEGKRSRVQGGILKAMGMKAGVSDFIFVLPPHGRIAALEIKAAKGKPTELQTDFMNRIISAGGLAAWFDNFDEALACLRLWGIVR